MTRAEPELPMANDEHGTSSRRRSAKVLVSVAAVVMLLAYLAWSLWDHNALTEWLQGAPPFPFFTVMALVPLFGVPITPFFIVAGAAFGTLLGAMGSLAAVGVNLGVSYLIARKLRPVLDALVRSFGYDLPSFGAEQKGALRFALAVKFAPGVPAAVKNYGLAAAGIDAWLYFGLSMLVTGTYAVWIVLLGGSLFNHDGGGVVIEAATLGALLLGVWWWQRRRARKPASAR